MRRVFAVDVERKRALTWSRETGAWEMLSSAGSIEDRALVAPPPIRALVDAAKADDAVARALLAKNNPVIAEAMVASEARGRAEAILEMLAGRNTAVSEGAKKRILACREIDVLRS